MLGAVLFFVLCSIFYVPWVMAQVKLETALPPIAGQPSPSEGLPQYINYMFVFGLGLITILVLGRMIIGGIMYILAAGNAAKVEDAKDVIFQALLGFGILLVSYLLLRTINPDLVSLKNPNLTPKSFQFQNLPAPAGPIGPNEPPQSGRESVLSYGVTSPSACASIGGEVFSPCQTYCLATPGLCSASKVCCGKKP